MVAPNGHRRFRSIAGGPLGPVGSRAECFRHSLARQSEASYETFLPDDARRECDHRESLKRSSAATFQPPLTEEDLRIHGWLIMRQVALDRKGRSVWRKIWQLLVGNWLGGKT
jgi:hypothetical protein